MLKEATSYKAGWLGHTFKLNEYLKHMKLNEQYIKKNIKLQNETIILSVNR